MNAMCRSALFAVALSLALSPCAVAGGVVFDTLGGLYSNLGDTYASIGSSGPLYQSFTAESLSFINTIELRLARPDSTTGGSIAVYLFANDESFNVPDLTNQLGFLGSLADSSITAGAAVYSLTFSGQFLDPGTRYWVAVTAVGGSNVEWAAVTDVSGIMTPAEFSLTQADVDAHTPVLSGNGNSPFRVKVGYDWGGGYGTVPEPSALVLGGCGLCLLGILRRRRNSASLPGRDD
jgi:hypothetical protein